MTRCVLVVLTIGTLAAPAFGQTPLPLTLDAAVARALETSDRLDEMTARQEAAAAVESQRQAASHPLLSATASYTRTNHVEEFTVPSASGGVRVIYPDVPDNIRSRIDLQWPIYTGGRLQALQRAAGAEADAAGRDRDAARADVKLEATRAFWAVVTARSSLEVVSQAVERTTAHLTDVRNQLDVGLVPTSDVLNIQALLAQQQRLVIEAENLVETVSADFRRIVGIEQDAPFELVADLAALAGSVPIESDPASLLETALGKRAERQSLTFRVAAAAERTAAAAAGRLPVLTAVSGYDFARPNPRIFPIQEKWKPSWDAGVHVRWSIFDSGRVSAEVAEAAAVRRAAEARRREFDAGVAVELRQRTADVSAARASIFAAEAGVRAAAEARRVLAERFSAGVATNTDVLNAQVALLQAELDLTRARANLHLASARLDRAMGL